MPSRLIALETVVFAECVADFFLCCSGGRSCTTRRILPRRGMLRGPGLAACPTQTGLLPRLSACCVEFVACFDFVGPSTLPRAFLLIPTDVLLEFSHAVLIDSQSALVRVPGFGWLRRIQLSLPQQSDHRRLQMLRQRSARTRVIFLSIAFRFC